MNDLILEDIGCENESVLLPMISLADFHTSFNKPI